MKTILKKVIPVPIWRIMHSAKRRWSHRNKPRYTTPISPSESTLACCISYNKYGGYCVPDSSRYRVAAQKVLSGEVWEPETIEYIISNCRDGDIIHAGTYFGDFLPALSRKCADKKIWAFEPNPENYRCAQITTQLNALENVELMNAGLGEHQDSLSMVTKDASGQSLGGGSSMRDTDFEGASEHIELVDIVSVDEIIPGQRNISIIQLDVEGFEQQALAGALGTIKRCSPILILETIPDQAWFSEKILGLGYEVVDKIHLNTIFAIKANK